METKTVRDFKKLQPGDKDHALFFGKSLLSEVAGKKHKTSENLIDLVASNAGVSSVDYF